MSRTRWDGSTILWLGAWIATWAALGAVSKDNISGLLQTGILKPRMVLFGTVMMKENKKPDRQPLSPQLSRFVGK